MINRSTLIAAFTLIVTACGSESDSDTADIVLLNGGIYTVDADQTWAEAAAIRDGVIVAVGSNESIRRQVGAKTEVIDLAGKMALPGFHDTHLHPLEGGYLMRQCDLTEDGTSVAAVIALLQTCAAEIQDEWIIGFGLDLALFDRTGPDKSLLDDIAPDRLFFVIAADGHSVLVNSRVLDLAGIDDQTPNPEGGVIERRSGGHEPNGTLRESAYDIVDALRPQRTLEGSVDAMRDALQAMNAAGITSFNDVWTGELEYQVYQALEQSGDLSLRVTASLIDEGVFEKHNGEDFERVLADREQYESDLIRTNGIKIMVDGVFEGETAALVEPYISLGHKGTLNHSRDDLRQRVERYDAMGLQIHMHTMGDEGTRAGLDAIEHARLTNSATNKFDDRRHTLSHLGLIHPDDRSRFAALGVAASFTAAWAYPSDWVTKLNVPVLGKNRVDSMYPIASMLQAGAVVVGGSDWIYGPLSPLDSLEVMVTRQDPYDVEGPVGNTSEAITLAEAIATYTSDAAWALHQESQTGSIEIGKKADIVVLDDNLFELPATSINDASVVTTIFNGKVVYGKATAH